MLAVQDVGEHLRDLTHRRYVALMAAHGAREPSCELKGTSNRMGIRVGQCARDPGDRLQSSAEHDLSEVR
jgi:hypothetical protein